MREIDPQSEGRLTEALRRLAASSSKGAPPQIGAGLLGEFRHYHARRRRIRRAGILALVVCITLAGAWTLSLRNRQRELGAVKQNESAPVNEAKQTPALPSPVVGPEPKQAVKISPSKPKSTKVVAARAQARSFN
ncbi:MAG TPA: hypothetical protein VE133_01595, partial [Candidatus Sulfotelmatobacter sp.]|nr:hypothetical protein [Candidatus Sulfotelmatobacter sp.]